MSGKVIRMSDYLVRRNRKTQLPYDEAEARAAARAMEEFDRIAATMDEESIDEYLLGTKLDTKYTG